MKKLTRYNFKTNSILTMGYLSTLKRKLLFLFSFLLLTNFCLADGVVIIGANGDSPNDFVFVATSNIAAGTSIFFTDREWTGTGFNTGEGVIEYIVPSGGLSTGDVVIVSDAGASDGGVIIETGGFDISGTTDPVYAYLGSSSANPTAVCSVFTDGTFPNATQDPTGDPLAPNVVVIELNNSAEDNAEYTGSRCFASITDFITAAQDASNYTFTDGTGIQSINFSTTLFIFNAGLKYEAIVDCDDNAGTQANFGEMYVHISNLQNADGSFPTTFTTNTGATASTIPAGSTSGTILITGLTASDFGNLITLTADNNGTTGTIEIPIPICGFNVDTGGDGTMEDDISNGVFCTDQNGETAPGILTQVISGNPILSGNNITSSYTYVLVDNTNGNSIIASNMTGVFDASDGIMNMNMYTVYAFYVSDDEQSDFDTALGSLTTITTGDDILTGSGAFANICYNFCCDASFTPNCCNADAGDITTSTTTSDFIICEGTDLLDDAMGSAAFTNDYTAADETDPNVSNPGDYETAFLTTDASGNILESNATGDFNFANDATYTGGNTYTIYALNYKIDNTPTTALAYLGALSPATIAQIIADDSDTSSGGAGGGAFCLDLVCSDASGSPVTVMILDEPDVSDQAGMACSDVASGITLGASTNSIAAATYNITNINQNSLTASAGSPATGNGLANSVIADDAYTNNTANDVDVVYTIVPVSADGCEGEPFMVTFTVKPEPVVADQTATVCSDDAIGVTLNASTSIAAADYNITAVVDPSLTGTATTGNMLANSAIANDVFTNTTAGDLDVVYTITPVSANDCEGDPFTVTVTIEPEPVVADQTATVCSDDAIGVTLNASTSIAAADYNITAVVDPSLTGAATTGNMLATSAIASDVFTNTTAGDLDVVYTITPVSANDCEGDPFTVTVTIEPEPVVADQTATVCSDDAIGVSLNSSTSIAAADYNITAVVDPSLTGTATTGNMLATSAIASDVFTNTTAGDLDVVYTITPVSANDCEGDPFTVTVTIQPEPVVADQTATVCSDDAIGVTLNASTSIAAADYNITAVVDPSLTGAATTGNMLATSAIASDVFTNTTAGDLDVVYTITPVSANDCEGDPFTVTVTIEPEPVVADQTATVCSDDAIGVTLNSSTSIAAADYNITAVVDPSLTGAATTGNMLATSAIASDVFTNTTAGNLDVVYTITPVSANDCEGDPFTVTVTIEPEPVVADQTATVCSDEAIGVTLNASTSIAAADYNITAVVDPSLTRAATTGNMLANSAIASDVFTNTTAGDLDVVYTITPVSANDCEGDPFTVTVTIEPEPVVADQTATVCSDEAIGVTLNSSTSIAAADYNITAVVDPSLTGAATTGNMLANSAIVNDVFTNTTAGDLDVVYTITPVSANDCEGDPFTVTVTIEPEPVVANQTATVCSDSPTGVTLNASTSVAVDGYNITAVVDPSLTGAATSGNGLADNAIANDVFTNSTTGSLDVVYTIVPVSAAGCEGNPFTVTVTIDPMVMVDLSSVATDLCYKSATDLIDLSGDYISGSTNGGIWTSSGDGTFSDVTNMHPAVISYTTGTNDRSQATVTLTLTANSGNACPADSDEITITIRDVTCTNNSFFGGNN